MALHINNPETERNVRALAEATGKPIAQAVNLAALQRLQELQPKVDRAEKIRKARVILRRVHRLPVLDTRTADEIIGYDRNGLPR